MLCGEKYHKVGAGKGAVHLLLVAHVADGGDVVEEMAVTNVDYAEIVALELREVVYNAGADESAAAYNRDFHCACVYNWFGICLMASITFLGRGSLMVWL